MRRVPSFHPQPCPANLLSPSSGARGWSAASCRDMYGTPDRHTLLESPGSGSTAHTWASVFVTPRKHRHNNVAALPPAHATPAPLTTQSAARRYCRARRLVAASSGAVWGLASPALLILGGGWEWLALARLAWAVGMLLLNNPHIWTPLRGLRCALFGVSLSRATGGRQVPDMANTGLDDKVRTQIFVDSLGLGRRLHNNE